VKIPRETSRPCCTAATTPEEETTIYTTCNILQTYLALKSLPIGFSTATLR
jgi:hypothetical protein